MLLEYAAAFLRAHGPRCAPAAGDAVVDGRDSFYRFKALRPRRRIGAVGSRNKPVLKNRVPQEIEDAVVTLPIEQPVFSQVRIANY
jgi:hypothetical protein